MRPWGMFLAPLLALLLPVAPGIGPGPARAAEDRVPVTLGGYLFPPYVFIDGKGKASGVSLDLMQAFHEMSPRYRFRFVPTTPVRRYQDMAAGRIDLIAFEMLAWGWEGKAVQASRPFLSGGEVYVAQAVRDRTQRWFDDVGARRIAAMRGYHYGFAGFQADPERLASTFAITLSDSHEANLGLVLTGKAELAVVTLEYLDHYLKERPEQRPLLLVSDRLDQSYRHSLVLRDGGPLSMEDAEWLLDGVQRGGRLDVILKKWGLTHLPRPVR